MPQVPILGPGFHYGAVLIGVRRASADRDLPPTLECCPIGCLKKLIWTSLKWYTISGEPLCTAMPQDLQTPVDTGQTLVPTGRRFLLLFLFLLGLLVLYPYFQSAGFGYYAFRVFGLVVTLLSVYAVSFRRSLILFALVLATPALLQRIVFFRVDASTLSIFNTLLTFVFDVFVVVVIFRRVFNKEHPSSETIFGALCIYLLVGFSFAPPPPPPPNIYMMTAMIQRHAFYLDPLTNLHSVPDRLDFIYYSFGTMTSLGAAGITPVSNQARSLSVIEAILGLLYLAVLISRLMGAYRPRHDH